MVFYKDLLDSLPQVNVFNAFKCLTSKKKIKSDVLLCLILDKNLY